MPCVVKWPGKIPAGEVSPEFMTMEDWLPTIMSAIGGQPNLREQLLDGLDVEDMNYRVHLDGVDQSDVIFGTGPSKRLEFYYFTETTLHGLRYGNWKFLFKKQDKWFNGTQENLTTPLITNLKLDPFERFHEARGFDEWQENRSWLLGPAGEQVGNFMKTLVDYPPRVKSFDMDIDALTTDQPIRRRVAERSSPVCEVRIRTATLTVTPARSSSTSTSGSGTSMYCRSRTIRSCPQLVSCGLPDERIVGEAKIGESEKWAIASFRRGITSTRRA